MNRSKLEYSQSDQKSVCLFREVRSDGMVVVLCRKQVVLAIIMTTVVGISKQDIHTVSLTFSSYIFMY